MKKVLIFLPCIFIFCLNGHSQLDLKIYTGVPELIGIGMEYLTSKDVGIEVATSYLDYRRSSDIFYGDFSTRTRTWYLNAMVKWYTAPKNNYSRFFYGFYIRHWYRIKMIDNLTMEEQEYAEEYNEVRSSQINKFSIGGLIGHKFRINNKLSAGYNFGLGFSPGISKDKWTFYDYTEKTFNYQGYFLSQKLSYMSILFQINFAYRIGGSRD